MAEVSRLWFCHRSSVILLSFIGAHPSPPVARHRSPVVLLPHEIPGRFAIHFPKPAGPALVCAVKYSGQRIISDTRSNQ
jgi:hypothetical protein